MDIYNMLPRIIFGSIALNIIGNTIKMTFKIKSKYIIWILMIISILINYLYFGFYFESLFIGLVTYSFSVTSYDLVKYSSKLIRKT